MFEALDVNAKDVFSANFVPFRSPAWADLHDPKGAIAFSRNLWTEVLENSPARLFMSLGKAAGPQVAAVVGATYESSHPVGWGKHKIDVYRNDRNQIVLALPHLSRFRIFGNGRTQAAEVVKTAAREAGL
ncbi:MULTISPECIES: hypothetical protein [unclassified Brevundimonas]|uniref:hypothetical protein n=1 Tax=unclassified Brevundimonas TaxID=2622653 RepID=UPI0025BB4BF4|nr:MULTISPECIES: hypothetical protein [unclassified Brevundimonas]